MTPEQLESLLEEEESAYLEFKEKIDLDSKEGKAHFLKEMLALANTLHSPAYLVIGVEDKTKKPLGVKDLTEERLQQVVVDHCKPPIPFSFHVIDYKNVPIGVVQVFRSNQRPHTLKTKYGYQDSTGKQQDIPDSRVFIRHGSTVGEATREELVAIAQDRDSNAEMIARAGAELERISSELSGVSYYLEAIHGQIDAVRLGRLFRRQVPDRLIEGTFISIVTGGLVGWLWAQGWNYAPVATPILMLLVSVLCSAFKIIDYGLTRAIVNSLLLGVAFGLLFMAGSTLATPLGGEIIYGSLVGAIAGIAGSILLRRMERQTSDLS